MWGNILTHIDVHHTGQHCPLAICPSLCRPLAQWSPSPQGWKVKARNVQLHSSRLKHEDPPHFWVHQK